MRMLKFALVFALVFPLGFLGYDYAHRSARADAAGGSSVVTAGSSEAIATPTAAPADTGSGSSSAPAPAIETPAAGSAATPAPTAKPSDALHDPVSDPGATLDDVKAAKKYGWGAAGFAVLLVVLKLASKAKSIGALAWLGKGRVATVVAGATVVLAGCYDTLMQGGSWVATAIAGGIAFATFYDSTHKPKE